MHITYNGHRARIVSGLGELAESQLSQTLRYEPKGAQFSPLAKKFIFAGGKRVYNKRYVASYDPSIKLFNKQTKEFPTGLLTQVMELFPTSTLEPELPIRAFLPTACLATLRDYQTDAVETLVTYARGMAELPTAAGKTIITAELCLRAAGMPVLVTVPGIDLLHQTAEELALFTGEPIGIYGDSERIIHRITVATVQTLTNGIGIAKKGGQLEYDLTSADLKDRLAWMNTIGYWIVDECHGAATDTYKQMSMALPNATLRHGLTATLKREDGADLVMEGVLGPCRYQITPLELVAKGWLVEPKVELHILDHKTYREGRSKLPYAATYNLAVTDNPNRMAYIRGQVVRCLSDGYGPVLVLFDLLEHGKNLMAVLKDLGRVALVNGATTTKQRKAVKLAIEAGEVDVVVASVVWVTGVNIKRLRSLIVAGSGRSAISLVQRAGRVLRPYPGKTDARIIDICDHEEAYLKDQYNARRFHYNDKYPGCVTLVEVEGIV